jgi:hypothetical protein
MPLFYLKMALISPITMAECAAMALPPCKKSFGVITTQTVQHLSEFQLPY